MPDTLTLSVPGKAEYVSTVRLAISSLAAKSGFDVTAIEDIKVAVSEACSNILCHSNIRDEYIYRVECTIHENKFEITVIDDGVGFDADSYKEPELGCIQGGGLGIYIIKALMDDVRVVSNDGAGTVIKMTKNISHSSASQAEKHNKR
ncbi:MAG: ATP-binding protein [Clostridiales Family XIII bacterium]|jgi:serine/threonine-protein kinase RsbW|nr:ATP-binding protein [Clostridiales Family XIII bacterium]